MIHFQKLSPHQIGRVVLLSIKPKYADLILAGSKRVEFRRSWASQGVYAIALYASSPVQKIVGLVEVESVLVASPSAMWKMCVERGGGLTRKELRDYFIGKAKGVAILLGNAIAPDFNLDPTEIVNDFVPPQSFKYLDDEECLKLGKMIGGLKVTDNDPYRRNPRSWKDLHFTTDLPSSTHSTCYS
jgi:predicted transcriptional regulator